MADQRLAVSLDCDDPGPLSAFWAALLDGTVTTTASGHAVVTVAPNLLVVAMRVEHYVAPTWPDGDVPKQAHLDVEVDDLDSAERRAIALGARPADFQRAPEIFRVLFDPAGHPFCLSAAFPA